MFTLPIALVIVFVPVLEVLPVIGETLSHDAD